ncbi:MAG: hypothetical protein IJ127_07250 [Afipia sp.]|nr:hypothetical protein [Afipia sp.]
MAEHPHGMKAETGTVELHHEPSAFGITAPGFVAIAMLVVVGIILWKRVPAMIGKMLDAKIDSIRRQLDEASALRAEAEAELARAKARTAASEADAASAKNRLTPRGAAAEGPADADEREAPQAAAGPAVTAPAGSWSRRARRCRRAGLSHLSLP